MIGGAAGARGSQLTRTLQPGEFIYVIASNYNATSASNGSGPYTLTVETAVVP